MSAIVTRDGLPPPVTPDLFRGPPRHKGWCGWWRGGPRNESGVTEEGGGVFAPPQIFALTPYSVIYLITIRADNIGGLAFYTNQGFVDLDVLTGVPLQDGTQVDRVRKRYLLG